MHDSGMEFVALEDARGLTRFDIDRLAALHRALAPSAHAYDIIHTHCEIVARLALSVARARGYEAADPNDFEPHPIPGSIPGNVPGSMSTTTPPVINERLLVMGGLIHDIGTYQLIKHDGSDGEPLRFKHSKYIQHGLRGYKLLRACGFDEALALFARNHTGIGLTARMVQDQDLPLPVADYVPVTLEQDLVMYADKFHTKSDPAEFVGFDRCIRRAAKHGEANARGMRDLIDRYGMPPVEAGAAEYGMVLR